MGDPKWARGLVSRDNLVLAVLLGVYWAWTASSVFQFSEATAALQPPRVNESSLQAALLVCAAATLALGVVRRIRHLMFDRRVVVAVCLCSVVGSLMTTLTPCDRLWQVALSGILVGIGEAFFLFRLCVEVDPASGTRAVLLVFSGMLVVCAVVYSAIELLGGLVAAVANAAVPLIVGTAILMRTDGCGTSGIREKRRLVGEPLLRLDGGADASASTVDAQVVGASSSAAAPGALSNASGLTGVSSVRFPWLALVGFSVFGVAFGVSRTVLSQDMLLQSTYYLDHQVIRAAVGLVIAVVALRAKNPFLWVGGLGVTCFFGAFILAFAQLDADVVSAINVASTSGYTCFEMIVWAVVYEIASETRVDIGTSYCLGRGTMQAGVFLGSVVAGALRGMPVSDPFAAVFQTSILVALLVQIGCFGARDFSELWGMERTALDRADDEEDVLRARLSERLGLTPRECDVAIYLTRGRSEPFIAESMALSRSTVHSHITRIYGKLGVHSRQEFLSLVERTVA